VIRFQSIGEHLWNAADRWFHLERTLSALQREKIAANPKSALPGSLIVADDDALIFLPKPQGPQVFASYRSRLAELSARM
jgi:hypothetical protein